MTTQDRDSKEITDDGYEIVRKRGPSQTIRGRQCGECGMKFDFNVAYGWACPQINNCPMKG